MLPLCYAAPYFFFFLGQGSSTRPSPHLHRVHVLRGQPASAAAQPVRAVQRGRHDRVRRRLHAARLVPLRLVHQPPASHPQLHHELRRLLLLQRRIQETHLVSS